MDELVAARPGLKAVVLAPAQWRIGPQVLPAVALSLVALVAAHLLLLARRRSRAAEHSAARAEVDVQTTSPDQVQVTARLDGETLDRERHTLLSEVKAVTYHQLTVERVPEGGWRASVLFDV